MKLLSEITTQGNTAVLLVTHSPRMRLEFFSETQLVLDDGALKNVNLQNVIGSWNLVGNPMKQVKFAQTWLPHTKLTWTCYYRGAPVNYSLRRRGFWSFVQRYAGENFVAGTEHQPVKGVLQVVTWHDKRRTLSFTSRAKLFAGS